MAQYINDSIDKQTKEHESEGKRLTGLSWLKSKAQDMAERNHVNQGERIKKLQEFIGPVRPEGVEGSTEFEQEVAQARPVAQPEAQPKDFTTNDVSGLIQNPPVTPERAEQVKNVEMGLKRQGEKLKSWFFTMPTPAIMDSVEKVKDRLTPLAAGGAIDPKDPNFISKVEDFFTGKSYGAKWGGIYFPPGSEQFPQGEILVKTSSERIMAHEMAHQFFGEYMSGPDKRAFGVEAFKLMDRARAEMDAGMQNVLTNVAAYPLNVSKAVGREPGSQISEEIAGIKEMYAEFARVNYEQPGIIQREFPEIARFYDEFFKEDQSQFPTFNPVGGIYGGTLERVFDNTRGKQRRV